MATKAKLEAVENTPERPDNLRIWNTVCKTDPRHTKKVNQRGGFTAISAHYQVLSATAAFGPVGIGWGYSNSEPIMLDGVVTVGVTLWHGNRENTYGPIWGGADLHDSRGKLDSDAPKKAATDGLTKALSHLGFNADVFLGKFDDNKYVADLTAEFAANDQRDDDPPQKVVGIHAIKQRLGKLLTEGNAATDLEAFNALVTTHKADLQTIKDANHEWWTGDGGDFEGYRAFIKRRREELGRPPESTAFQLLASLVAECKTYSDLQSLIDEHDGKISELDGEERRRFDEAYNSRESAILAPTPLETGLVGG